MSGDTGWREVLDVFLIQARKLPNGWEDVFWTSTMIDIAKVLVETRSTLSAEHQGVLVSAGAMIAAQVMKESDARDLAVATIAQAQRNGGEA
jgi:hypothetical protein